jgi:hypothetical protein
VLALAGRDSTDDQVIFNVCDVLLLLLEHEVMTDEGEKAQVCHAAPQLPSRALMFSRGLFLLHDPLAFLTMMDLSPVSS